MSDYISVCKSMNVPRPAFGQILIQKWADQLGFDQTKIREGARMYSTINETREKKPESNFEKKINKCKKSEKHLCKIQISHNNKVNHSGDYIGSLPHQCMSDL